VCPALLLPHLVWCAGEWMCPQCEQHMNTQEGLWKVKCCTNKRHHPFMQHDPTCANSGEVCVVEGCKAGCGNKRKVGAIAAGCPVDAAHAATAACVASPACAAAATCTAAAAKLVPLLQCVSLPLGLQRCYRWACTAATAHLVLLSPLSLHRRCG
jgi:hypothetical protein